jgi:hypothetical protein
MLIALLLQLHLPTQLGLAFKVTVELHLLLEFHTSVVE